MDLDARIMRLARRAHEFDTAGLGIISYYLRLYTVETVLDRKDRTEEQTHFAMELMDRIESFKQSVDELDDGTREKEVLQTLVSDNKRAMTYVLNFTMSLYNKKLAQVQTGPWDRDFTQALWCCVDLFGCILHLWPGEIDDPEQLTKRIKVCKVCISRAAKGELGQKETTPGSEEKELSTEYELPGGGTTPDEKTEGPAEHTSNDVSSSEEAVVSEEDVSSSEEAVVSEEDVSQELVETESPDHTSTPESPGTVVQDETKFIDDTPREPKFIDDVPGSNPQDEPKFIDDSPSLNTHDQPKFIDDLPTTNTQDEPEFVDDSPSPNTQGKPKLVDDLPSSNTQDEPLPVEDSPKAPTKHTQSALHAMMDRTSAIEQVQKNAKYAISALNYEDIDTAKDELRKALAMLERL